ncbi:LpqN/LpqT family lipoprotein [Mycobacterium sp. ML4]
MMQIARSWRTLVGGLAAGVVGVVMVAGGTASAEPLVPQPSLPGPVPMQPAAPPAQNSTVFPGGVNRFAPAPAQAPAQVPLPAPAASPLPTVAPAAAPATGPAPAVAAPQPPAVTPATTGTLREYLEGKGVKLEAQRPLGFKALEITVPMPPRWTQVPDPNVPDAFVVIADRVGGNSVYTSNAQVVVYKLIGDFDAAEAITHGFVDSQRLLAWQTTNASLTNLGTFPSSVIEGTYRENDMTLNTSRRHVLAHSGSDKYLVSLSVTTAATQAVSDAPATDAIVSGFRVGTPGVGGPAPARTGTPAAPAAPAPQAPVRPAAPTTPQAAAQPAAPAPLEAIRPAPRGVPVPSQAPATPPLVTLTPAPSH